MIRILSRIHCHTLFDCSRQCYYNVLLPCIAPSIAVDCGFVEALHPLMGHICILCIYHLVSDELGVLISLEVLTDRSRSWEGYTVLLKATISGEDVQVSSGKEAELLKVTTSDNLSDSWVFVPVSGTLFLPSRYLCFNTWDPELLCIQFHCDVTTHRFRCCI